MAAARCCPRVERTEAKKVTGWGGELPIHNSPFRVAAPRAYQGDAREAGCCELDDSQPPGYGAAAMSMLIRWPLVLMMFAIGFFPTAAGGFVLCVDRGPDAHIAIEWGGCNDPRVVSPVSAPPFGASLSCETECGACEDVALPGWDGGGIPRLKISAATLVPPSCDGAVLAPRLAEGVPLPAASPRPRVVPSLPLALRI